MLSLPLGLLDEESLLGGKGTAFQLLRAPLHPRSLGVIHQAKPLAPTSIISLCHTRPEQQSRASGGEGGVVRRRRSHQR